MVYLPQLGHSPSLGIGCCRFNRLRTVACLLEQDLQVFLRPAPEVLKSGNWSSGLTSPQSLHFLETFCIVIGVNDLVSKMTKTCIF